MEEVSSTAIVEEETESEEQIEVSPEADEIKTEEDVVPMNQIDHVESITEVNKMELRSIKVYAGDEESEKKDDIPSDSTIIDCKKDGIHLVSQGVDDKEKSLAMVPENNAVVNEVVVEEERGIPSDSIDEKEKIEEGRDTQDSFESGVESNWNEYRVRAVNSARIELESALEQMNTFGQAIVESHDKSRREIGEACDMIRMKKRKIDCSIEAYKKTANLEHKHFEEFGAQYTRAFNKLKNLDPSVIYPEIPTIKKRVNGCNKLRRASVQLDDSEDLF